MYSKSRWEGQCLMIQRWDEKEREIASRGLLLIPSVLKKDVGKIDVLEYRCEAQWQYRQWIKLYYVIITKQCMFLLMLLIVWRSNKAEGTLPGAPSRDFLNTYMLGYNPDAQRVGNDISLQTASSALPKRVSSWNFGIGRPSIKWCNAATYVLLSSSSQSIPLGKLAGARLGSGFSI